MRLQNEKVNGAGQVDMSRLPRHIAIIMDGNGRWAQKRGLPRTAGHKAGAETFRRIGIACRDLGIEYLTVYAFSTENWKRPAEEVDTIMGLLKKYLQDAARQLHESQIRLRFFGDMSALSPDLQELIRRTDALSDENPDFFQANICLNYGGRDEIVHAARLCAAKGLDFTEENMAACMYSSGVVDPELIIRPGGEQRISNFLLWQSAYSEFYFTDTLWPDFTEETLYEAIRAYQSRDRRFGGIKK